MYPLCKLLAATLWKAWFAEAPQDPEAGRRLKRGLLQAGGHRDPAEVVRVLLGRDALVQVGRGKK